MPWHYLVQLAHAAASTQDALLSPTGPHRSQKSGAACPITQHSELVFRPAVMWQIVPCGLA